METTFDSVRDAYQKFRTALIISKGPRQLSIADVESIPVIHGATSKCTKGTWYSASRNLEGGSSLHLTRDKKDHRERRRVWDNAFNVKSLRDYEPRIHRHTIELINQLRARESKSLRASNWFNFYSFDVMGDVGFSRSFDMVSKGKEDKLISDLHASMAPAGLFRNIMWSISLLLRIPGAGNEIKNFISWTHGVLKERQKVRASQHHELYYAHRSTI
jgi:cytochrome P450 family 628